MWFAKRIAMSLLLVWMVATMAFGAIHIVPGDPAEIMLSEGGFAPDPSAVAALREELGLDRPLLTQYGDWVRGLVRGELGHSLLDQEPVGELIGRRLPRTLELILVATLFAALVGIPLGVLAAVRRGSLLDRCLNGFAALFDGMPVFVIATLLILVLARQLGWVSTGGYVPFAQNPAEHIRLLLMPSIAIGLGFAAVVLRMTRAAVLDTLNRDFVRTARSKGAAPLRILVRHVLRNALMPVITVVALHMGAMLGGTVLTEFVFNWPGISSMMVDAVNSRDYPVVVGTLFVIASLFVALNLAVDLLYGLIDPRVRA
ncbi:ABC transporter permease [Roseomonas sp. HJA6]|uniref:ABC transporter permease n=1 Tax=Roseomonas alba TaxID=2846776 RepID=A0ABS7A9W2_9PROT|nr:ABC transporter permease [Neoroseomonas alba]MBW6399087.1 ABC transporter permease [Neoroseomonas alba]